VVPDRFRPGVGKQDQLHNFIQEVHELVLRSAFTRPFYLFPLPEPSGQRGDEPDQLTPASVSDTIYLPHCIATSFHTKDPIGKVYADKGYYGEPNRDFLHMNGIADGIMRRDTRSTKLTDYEKERNKGISKKRYIVEQYFGLSHLHSQAFRARFTRIVKNVIDALFRQMAFNLFRGGRILGTV
jgi:hypothetical protein